MIATLVNNLTTEAAGESLSALCSEAKTKAGREAIEAALGGRETLYALLLSESPKVRKNTYRLLGALQNPKDLPKLTESLQTEILQIKSERIQLQLQLNIIIFRSILQHRFLQLILQLNQAKRFRLKNVHMKKLL